MRAECKINLLKYESSTPLTVITYDMTHRHDAEEKIKSRTKLRSITVKGVCAGIIGEP